MTGLSSLPFASDGRSADICVVGGAGHVGLPLSIVFALKGQRVLIYDIDRDALALIARGEMPFMEQGAEPPLRELLGKGALGLTGNPAAIAGVPTIVIAIGTPVDKFFNPNLDVIRQCVDELLPFLSDGQLVVLRSTVCPGTTDWLAKYLLGNGKQVQVSFCPERVVQGHAIEELQAFPQIVSGVTEGATEAAAKVFGLVAADIVRLSPTEAEFAKLFSNAYRYIHFAIANQLYMIATAAGVDYYRVLEGVKKNYSRMRDLPSAGFTAGPCLFKDTMQLVACSKNQATLGHAAMLINEGLPLFIVERLEKKWDLERCTVGLLGMAFKADNDDPRSSLSYKLKKILRMKTNAVLTTDPYVKGDRDIVSVDEVISGSDVLILCVPHTVYKGLDVRGRPTVDVWNFWGRGTGL